MGKKMGKCIAAAVIWASLAACSAAEYPLKDGYYSAEAAEFNVYGWKEYITIYVSSGRILLVEYNAFNASGFIRSWDMSYMRGMEAARGVYPSAYTRYYGDRLLIQQGTEDVHHLSGATESYHSFMQLAEAALENARQGDSETSMITLSETPGSRR